MANVVRVSTNQKLTLIEHLFDNKDMFYGEITDSFTHEECERMWEELKNKLNSLRGCQKDANEWKKYWSAYKFRVETKTASIMNFYDRPGCDYGIEPILIPLEERIINMIWNKDVMDYVPDFVEDSNSSPAISPIPEISPDPLPMEFSYREQQEQRKKCLDLVTDRLEKSEEQWLQHQNEMRSNTAEITTKLDEVIAAIKELTAVMKEFAENQQK